ncbi:holin class III [Streptomyces phage Shady]|uniref:Holin class III n=1 Tax=Streptomyces phage Shady TaxID=2767585 RepID=A0A873WLC6_9CAUD|nr:holin class III [Streptomyces phage Shady]
MNFVKTNPARVYAVVVSALALVAFYVPTLPVELLLGVVAATLGLGEAVQRTENAKTATAFAALPLACQNCPATGCADCPRLDA